LDDGREATTSWRSHDPSFARMMVASRPRHGEAMMRASPARHPGKARMIKNYLIF
jgi:hypothetical protein